MPDLRTASYCTTYFQKTATRYSETHWKDTDTIADLSISNHIEMRAHVNSRIFILSKYLDDKLHTLFLVSCENGC